MKQSADKVIKNILSLHDRKIASVRAICLYYAAQALRYFRQEQRANRFWVNRTNQAMDTVFSGIVDSKNELGWGLAHWIEYGVYLELAHGRQNAALKPVVEYFVADFIKDIREVYGVQ